ncbi:MAG: efflux RND transporter periplasmic adaptor subunit [Terriglobia bacterium]
MANNETRKKPVRARALFYVVGAALVVAALLLMSRIKSRSAKQAASLLRQEQTVARAGPMVNVITVAEDPPSQTLTLLGETRPYLQTTLYAKVSGYLKSIDVDKGDDVGPGKVLAVIESPETDAQYHGAVINAHNLNAIAQRDEDLVKRDMISQQDAQTAVAEASMARQDVLNLATLRSYEVIRAPFAGKITARYADPGALMQAATGSQTAALPLVRISETDRERLFIYPDQGQAAYIHVGDRARITDPASPGVRLSARVERISGEFDPSTRTMLTEIDFNNRSGLIAPGSFVQVTLRLRKSSIDLEIPAAALVLRGAKTFVAVIGPGNQVKYRPVVVANDNGVQVSIRSGLRAGETIAVNLGDSVADGGKIQPVRAVPQ